MMRRHGKLKILTGVLIAVVMYFTSVADWCSHYEVKIPLNNDEVCNDSLGPTVKQDMDKIKSYSFPGVEKYITELFPSNLPDEHNMPQYPVLVTAASASHYTELMDLVYNMSAVRRKYSEIKLVIYDLGFSNSQVKEIDDKCKCEVRKFKFEDFPDHVRILKGYAWKPIIIQVMMNPDNQATTSTPKPTPRANNRQQVKRARNEVESTSSVEDVSLLDLDSGKVVSAKTELVTLPKSHLDNIISKLTVLENGLAKLEKLDKLDSIEINISKMANKLTDLEKRVTINETKVIEIEGGLEFISKQYDSVVSNSSKLEQSVKSTKRENEELKHTLHEMKNINCQLKEDLLDIRCRSMRDNLIFTNINEQPHENTEKVLADFLQHKLNLSNIKIERAHRIRSRRDNQHQGRSRPAPIVAKFSFFKDRETIRKSGRLLKGTHFSIQEQFPDEIEQRRKPLYPLLREVRRRRQRAVLVKDKLYVNGEEVKAPTANHSATSSYRQGVRNSVENNG